MNTASKIRELQELARASDEPEKIRNLIKLIGMESGFALYQLVAEAKAKLSSADSVCLNLESIGVPFQKVIDRSSFENWIRDDLERVSLTIDEALNDADVAAKDIDRIYLTGGTSFVPAVRRLFEDRFPKAELATGREFQSVSEGLALIGRDRSRLMVS